MKFMGRIWCNLFIPLVAVLVGCSAVSTPLQEDSSNEPTSEIQEGKTPVPTKTGSFITPTENTEEDIVIEPTADSASYDPALEPLVTTALEDLSGRLGIAAEQIEVIEARMVVWPDASLGCPQPGMAYIQVPRDGALIRLSAEGQEYDYHSGGNRGLFLCEESLQSSKNAPRSEPLPPPGSADE